MRRLLYLMILLPMVANAHDPGENAKARLFLTSAAINVLDTLVPLLRVQTGEHSACYVTTAGNLEGSPAWMDDEIVAIEQAGLEVTRIDLSTLSPHTVDAAFAGCDSIWVGGGNTYYLLQEVRRSRFDQLVTSRIREGVPYIGTSAGSVILAPNLECIKYAEEHPDLELELTDFDGLGVFPLLPLVHFDNPAFKTVYAKILDDALANDVAFVTLKEQQFIVVEGDEWRVVDSD